MESQASLGILGPKGTHSEAAAIFLNAHLKQSYRLVEYGEIFEVLQELKEGRVDRCLVPVENMLEGSINITLDVLAGSDELRVVRELVWPVHNYLMAKCGAEEIKKVFSHPQPIAQCQNYLRRHCPQAEVVKVSSTARAAELVGAEPRESGWAAICSQRAGELNGLLTVAAEIQDNMGNCTRFFEIARKDALPCTEKRDKALVICQVDGTRAGSLCDVLEEFASRHVNLTRIESRPARTRLGVYIFFFELEIGTDEEALRDSLEAVSKKCIWLRNVGEFPVLEA